MVLKVFTPTPELLDLARRTVWFKSPEIALLKANHFVAYVLTYGTSEDCRILNKYLTREELVQLLRDAPPGIFDARSWSYWHVMTDQYPAPPLHVREIS
jgi:hypothetical protein